MDVKKELKGEALEDPGSLPGKSRFVPPLLNPPSQARRYGNGQQVAFRQLRRLYFSLSLLKVTLINLEPQSQKKPPGGGEEKEGAAGRSCESQVPVKAFKAHSDAITAARLCCNDRCILSSSSDCSAILWDVEGFRPLRTFSGVHSRTITECVPIPNSNRMVTVSWDKEMVAWDLETGHVLWKTKLGGLLTSCSCSVDGRLLACAADPQRAIYICSASGGQTLHHFSNHHSSTITRCRFDPTNQRVASVSADRSIKLWDVQAQRTTMSISSNHSNVVSDCCFNSNGHFLYTASWDKTLKLWDLQGGEFRSQGGTTLQPSHEGSVSSCVLSADATLLVSGSYDRTVALWDPSLLCRTLVLKGHSDWVTDVSLSADKKLVASSSKDGTVRIWNVENIDEIPEVMQKKSGEGTGVEILKTADLGAADALRLLSPQSSAQIPTPAAAGHVTSAGRVSASQMSDVIASSRGAFISLGPSETGPELRVDDGSWCYHGYDAFRDAPLIT
ncbi:uncharacterized protein FYW61_000447 [Anableps anableps]